MLVGVTLMQDVGVGVVLERVVGDGTAHLRRSKATVPRWLTK